MEEKKVMIVVGATGSGKSNLAVQLACSLGNSEILSVDSMQIYKVSFYFIIFSFFITFFFPFLIFIVLKLNIKLLKMIF